MADDKDLKKDISDIGNFGQEAKRVFEDLNTSIQGFNSQLKLSQNLSDELASIGEKVQRGAASSVDLIEAANKARKRSNLFDSKASELLKKAEAERIKAAQNNNKNNKAKEKFYREQAALLQEAARQASAVGNKFDRLREINAELNKGSRFMDFLSNAASKIPGLEGISDALTDSAAALRVAKLEGAGAVGTFGAIATALGKLSLVAFFTQALKVDEEITNLGRNLNLSREEAIGLKNEFANIAKNSENLAITSEKLAQANTKLNSQLGTAFVFSSDITKQFSILTEIVGVSAEAAGSLAFQSQRLGREFEDVKLDVLDTTYALQRSSGIALNNREILEATGKVTGQVRANLGANPKAIAEAVTQAKLLGAELDDILDTSKSLLNFESSIENELKAELLTGKQLNLERARALSLAGDQAGLAEELTDQLGSFTEFSKLNVIQQNELATAFGLSSDRLSDILLKQEFQNMNAEDLRALGKEDLANRLEQLNMQEKITLAADKFRSLLGDMAVVAMPILEVFGGMFKYLAESPRLLNTLAVIMGGLAARSLVLAIASIFTSVAPLGPLALIAGAAGVALMMAQISKINSSIPNMAEGGVMEVKPRAGGQLVQFNAGEAGRAERVTVEPLNRRTSQQPNVTVNIPQVVASVDSFGWSNNSGLAAIQNKQMPRTMA